jgi:hypothetical protein
MYKQRRYSVAANNLVRDIRVVAPDTRPFPLAHDCPQGILVWTTHRPSTVPFKTRSDAPDEHMGMMPLINMNFWKVDLRMTLLSSFPTVP